MNRTNQKNRSIAYSVSGDGPVVVLAHPLFRSGRAWTRSGYTGELSKRFRVVELDLPGHGGSTGSADPDDCGPAAMSSAVVAVLDRLGVERAAAIWGYSYGGWPVSCVAEHASHRFARFAIGGWDPVDRMNRTHLQLQNAFDLPPDSDWFGLISEAARMDPDLRDESERWDEDVLRACYEAMCAAEVTMGLRSLGSRLLCYSGGSDLCNPGMVAFAGSTGARSITAEGFDHETAWGERRQILELVMPFLNSDDPA